MVVIIISLFLWIVVCTASSSQSSSCSCSAGLECTLSDDGYYCSCPVEENIFSIESYSNSTYYWRYNRPVGGGGDSSELVSLELYNATSDKSVLDESFYFTSCTKYTNGHTGDIRSIQPAFSKDRTRSWLYYNNWDLGVFIDNSTIEDIDQFLSENAVFEFEKNRWIEGTYALKLVYYTGFYVRQLNGRLTFGHNDDTVHFHQDASFIIHIENPTVFTLPGPRVLSPLDIFRITVIVSIAGVLLIIAIVWFTRKLIVLGESEERDLKKKLLKTLNPFDEI